MALAKEVELGTDKKNLYNQLLFQRNEVKNTSNVV